MLKFLLRLIAGLVVLVAIALAAGYYLLQDPNRFKAEIEQFIADQTGAEVDLGTDLAWQLFPPLALSASGVSAEYEGSHYELAAMRLDLDLMSVIRSRDINQWEVQALTLNDLVIAQDGARTRVESLVLRNFRPATPSPFSASLSQRSADGTELPLTLEGLISLDPDTQKAALSSTRFETTAASGTCNLDATYRGGSQPPDPEDAIIPVSIWRSIDWSGTCNLDRLTLEEEEFRNVAVTLNNSGGGSTTDVRFPEFFGGSAGTTLDIDASRTPVRWRVQPDLARADSTELMAWLDQRLKWIAPLAYSGEITMTGNTTEELVRSVQGATTFDGGQGRIDIAQIKQPLLNLATLFKEPERIAAWPDLWSYQRLVGEWVVNGTNHQLDLALDNLTAAVRGDYDPLADALDMNVEFMFEEIAQAHGFDVNPVLVGLAIPLRCTGSLDSPKCGVTADATRKLVATVLTSEQGSEVREKIDQAIEEKVPEEYREAARGLLDLLGESLKQQQKQKESP